MARKIILRLLSVLPFGLVSFAAKAALQDVVDQGSLKSMELKLQRRRLMIMEEGASSASIGEAMARFKSRKAGNLNDAEFWKLVDDLEEKGLLQRHGEYLVAAGESQH
jgi:hypothetical protein